MAAVITHAFQSGIADGVDNTLVQPTDWNDNHVITGRSLLRNQIAVGATSYTIIHNLNSTYSCLIGWSTTWPTELWVTSTGSTNMSVEFSVPATTVSMLLISNVETIT